MSNHRKSKMLFTDLVRPHRHIRRAWCLLCFFQKSSPHARNWFAPGSVPSYILGMKTAISIPNKIYRDAERLSRRLKKSRSQVYTEAVTEYVARHDPESVTGAMNRVCEAVDTRPDPAISGAARRTLEGVEW